MCFNGVGITPTWKKKLKNSSFIARITISCTTHETINSYLFFLRFLTFLFDFYTLHIINVM